MDNDLCKEAGIRIRSLRKGKAYSRDEFAEKAGISSKFLYEIEKGRKRFSAETLCRIAQVLEVSCDYIMFGKLIQVEDETGIVEVVKCFNNTQQRKLIPILKLMYKLINE